MNLFSNVKSVKLNFCAIGPLIKYSFNRNMFLCISVVYVTFILQVVGSISIKGLRVPRTEYADDRAILHRHYVPNVSYKTEGIFETFLKNIINLLSTSFPEKKLPKYCRILSRELDKMGFKYTTRLAKHLKYLTRMYRSDLKNEMVTYRQELFNGLPYKKVFLEAMNDVFTLKEKILFSDYIYDLRDYGTEDKLYIHDETSKILNKVILDSIHKLSIKDQIELEKKLKRAIKEYKS